MTDAMKRFNQLKQRMTKEIGQHQQRKRTTASKQKRSLWAKQGTPLMEPLKRIDRSKVKSTPRPISMSNGTDAIRYGEPVPITEEIPWWKKVDIKEHWYDTLLDYWIPDVWDFSQLTKSTNQVN